MKTTTEIEIKVSGAKVTNALIMPDGTYKLTMVNEVKDDEFVLVEASKLSLNDEFMQYKPEWFAEQREFKRLLVRAIKSGVKDFRRPMYDPSFNKDDGICYEIGKLPAVGKSYRWWEQVAKKFKPEYNSRLGTKSEYVAFLGVLIKKLVESGWSVQNAWYAVCSDSKELGHYWNSENQYGQYSLEPTGNREICGFYDLANCNKILAEDKETGGFWIASGNWRIDHNYPLADMKYLVKNDRDLTDSVGWLVLD